jgi:hypothetical protein
MFKVADSTNVSRNWRNGSVTANFFVGLIRFEVKLLRYDGQKRSSGSRLRVGGFLLLVAKSYKGAASGLSSMSGICYNAT